MILVVADRWDPARGGRERYAADLVAFLSAEGRRVSVLCGARALDAGVPCEVVGGMRAIQERRLRRALAAWVDRTPAACVLAMSPTRGATHYQLHGGLLARSFEAERESMDSAARRAAFGAALALNRRRQRLLAEETRLVEGATALMTFSNAAARQLVDDRGVPAARVVVARPGVDLRTFRAPSSFDEDDSPAARPLRLALVGHNFALKGLRAAILALARLRRDGVAATLTVAGRGSDRGYRQLAARASVENHVQFAGALSQERVADLLRASDALVHPTFYDPFPRVAIEALACGCPVITTARCGAAEILTHGREGFVIPDPRDVVRLAHAIGALVDERRRREMRRAAAALATRFDAETHFRVAADWLCGEHASRATARQALSRDSAPRAAAGK